MYIPFHLLDMFYICSYSSAASLSTSDLHSQRLKRVSYSKMRAKFFGLVVKVSRTLGQKMSLRLDQQNGEETFQQFREYVAGLCTIENSRKQNAATVEEIFGLIHEKKCWDLQGDPYDLLVEVLCEVADAELMAIVEKSHEEYYTEYMVATKVADHLPNLQTETLSEYSPNFSRLTMKLDKVNVTECSIAYLTELWKNVKRCVQLPDLFSVLAGIEEGCIAVTWLIPTYAVPALTRLPQTSPELFHTFAITRMDINGVCFFNVSSRSCIQVEFSLRTSVISYDLESPKPGPAIIIANNCGGTFTMGTQS